jgi:hypothetical protein
MRSAKLKHAIAVDGGGQVFEGCGVEVGAAAQQRGFQGFGGGDGDEAVHRRLRW